jgi:SAM-dependent methyltransferase
MRENKDWFEKWFDSPYYHLLYKHRDVKEAEFFIANLTRELPLKKEARILDMACGKGRHCIFLAKQGFDVTGTDLSEQSITEAKSHESDHLSFFVHDMRRPFRVNYYDCVLNLFTSFGYFDSPAENEKVVLNACGALKPGGLFVLDFMNASFVNDHLCAQEKKAVDGIEFEIKRYRKEGFICKEIHLTDKGAPHHFI